jgi:hypothetical protein
MVKPCVVFRLKLVDPFLKGTAIKLRKSLRRSKTALAVF